MYRWISGHRGKASQQNLQVLCAGQLPRVKCYKFMCYFEHLCSRKNKQERREWLETSSFSTNTKADISKIKRHSQKKLQAPQDDPEICGYTGVYSSFGLCMRRVIPGLPWDTVDTCRPQDVQGARATRHSMPHPWSIVLGQEETGIRLVKLWLLLSSKSVFGKTHLTGSLPWDSCRFLLFWPDLGSLGDVKHTRCHGY